VNVGRVVGGGVNLDGGCWTHEFWDTDGAVGRVIELVLSFLKFVGALSSIFSRGATRMVGGLVEGMKIGVII
jgi:hypothetical protein